MLEFWNARYANENYAYGKEPNSFLASTLSEFNPKGSILLPAEGEGRNAVYAAKQGLKVTAFDISEEGKKKALKLAKKESVSIDYQVGEFFDLPLANETYDVAALIYAHFPPTILSRYYQKVAELIKPDGLVILEGFSKGHLALQKANPKVGGPKKADFLFSTKSVINDFKNFEVLLLEEKEIELNEGEFHQGKGSVIRFIGRKMN